MVHRNLLLPCDHLPLELPSAQTPLQQRKTQTSTKRKRTPCYDQQQQPASDSGSEDDDGDGTYQWHLRSGREREQHQANPETEPFQPHQGSPPLEEDVPLQSEEDVPQQSEEVANVSQLVEQHELDPPASVVPESGELGEELSRMVRAHPHRLRQPPVILSYETLGQPSLITRHCEVIETQYNEQRHYGDLGRTLVEMSGDIKNRGGECGNVCFQRH